MLALKVFKLSSSNFVFFDKKCFFLQNNGCVAAKSQEAWRCCQHRTECQHPVHTS